MKIADKISLSFLAVATVLTAVFGFVVLKVSEDSLRKEIVAHLETTARSRGEHVETYLQFIKASTAQLSKSVVLEKFLETDKSGPEWNKMFQEAMLRLQRSKEVNPSIYEFLLMDGAGKVVASSNPASIGQDRSDDAIFTGGQTKPHIKDVYLSQAYKMPLIAVSAPIVSRVTGKTVGVIASRDTLTDLDRIVTATTGLGTTGEIYIVNKNGYMVAPLLRYRKDPFMKRKVDTENFRACMRRHGKNERFPETIVCSDYRGAKVLGTSTFIDEMHWALLAEIELNEAFAPLKTLRIIFILAFAMIPLIAWLIGRAIASFITAPLHNLHKGTEIIGAGNLAYRVGTKANDEVGQLSRAFDAMTSELKKKIVTIYDLNKEIAERKKAEGQYHLLADNITDFVWLMDMRMRFTYVSPSVTRLLGYSPEEALAGTVAHILTPDSFKAADAAFREELAMEHMPQKDLHRTRTLELENVRKDGSRVWCETKMTYVRDANDTAIGVVGTTRDISERKKAESDLRIAYEDLKAAQQALVEAEKMSALGRFSYGASHEIKNPLGIILGGLEYLRAKFPGADKESRETIGMVSDAVLRVDAIINALAALAKPSDGSPNVADADALINEAILLIRPKLAGRQLIFERPSAGGALHVEVDIDQMQHALVSILENAVDATPEDGIIRVRAYQEAQKCMIEIIDTGEGISTENMPRIFEPFFTTRRDKKKIGFGLTMARAFVNINRGTIAITSEKGKGATVKIALPLLP